MKVRCERKRNKTCRETWLTCQHARVHQPMTDMLDGTSACTEAGMCPLNRRKVKCEPHLPRGKDF
jgi:hypothetical protein